MRSALILAITIFLAAAGYARAEPPRLRESLPAADAVITGKHASYRVRFDAPVDHAASRMTILRDGKVTQTLRPLLDSAVDVLFAEAEAPPPGRYVLHWEARSPAGEVGSGDVPFSVAP